MNISQKQGTDRDASISTARALCASGFLVLDVETTSVGAHDEIVQLALFEYTPEGETKELVYSLVQPTRAMIDYKAWEVHKITNGMITKAGAPNITAFGFALAAHIYRLPLVIFNKAFDLRFLRQSFEIAGAPLPYDEKRLNVVCAMQLYTNFKAEMLNAKGRGGYKRQSLPGGDHSGRGDCLATVELIRTIANAPTVLQVGQLDLMKQVLHGEGSITSEPPATPASLVQFHDTPDEQGAFLDAFFAPLGAGDAMGSDEELDLDTDPNDL